MYLKILDSVFYWIILVSILVGYTIFLETFKVKLLLYLVSILLNYFYCNFLIESILVKYFIKTIKLFLLKLFKWILVHFNEHSANKYYTLIAKIVSCTLHQCEVEGNFKGEKKMAIWRETWRECGNKKLKDWRFNTYLIHTYMYLIHICMY